jgi:hypothetical protein
MYVQHKIEKVVKASSPVVDTRGHDSWKRETLKAFEWKLNNCVAKLQWQYNLSTVKNIDSL